MKRSTFLSASILIATLIMPVTTAESSGGSQWRMGGHDLSNTRFQNAENKLTPATAPDLSVLWEFTTGGDVSATPAVDGTTVYFPDWAGNLYAVNRNTGALRWSRQISEYTGVPGNAARTTPVIFGDLLIFGDQGGQVGAGARMMAVNKGTGDLVWVTQVEENFAAIITQSAVVYDAAEPPVLYVGVSSSEEAFAAFLPGYECCTFRGSMLALDAGTGQILWRTYMVPDGYSGGAIWGSTPVIDRERGSVYVATGNNYSMPDEVLECVVAAGEDPDAVRACIAADNYFDAIVSMDLASGAVKWATFALPVDAWNVACIPGLGNPENCPLPTGPDYDFGQGPALIKLKGPLQDGVLREFLGAGQKSGQYWAFDPATGDVLWVTQVGPGGVAGGLQWGSASDGTRIYVSNANSLGIEWELMDGSTTTGGIWSALDAATGELLWDVADPLGAGDGGAVSTAKGVVYVCSLDPLGHMYALDAVDGDILWSHASGGSCNSGPAISNGQVFWGSGYVRLGGTPNNTFYAFALP